MPAISGSKAGASTRRPSSGIQRRADALTQGGEPEGTARGLNPFRRGRTRKKAESRLYLLEIATNLVRENIVLVDEELPVVRCSPDLPSPAHRPCHSQQHDKACRESDQREQGTGDHGNKVSAEPCKESRPQNRPQSSNAQEHGAEPASKSYQPPAPASAATSASTSTRRTARAKRSSGAEPADTPTTPTPTPPRNIRDDGTAVIRARVNASRAGRSRTEGTDAGRKTERQEESRRAETPGPPERASTRRARGSSTPENRPAHECRPVPETHEWRPSSQIS